MGTGRGDRSVRGHVSAVLQDQELLSVSWPRFSLSPVGWHHALGFGNKPGPWCRAVPGHRPTSLFRPLACEQIDISFSLNSLTGAPGAVLLVREAQEGREGRATPLLLVGVCEEQGPWAQAGGLCTPTACHMTSGSQAGARCDSERQHCHQSISTVQRGSQHVPSLAG